MPTSLLIHRYTQALYVCAAVGTIGTAYTFYLMNDPCTDYSDRCLGSPKAAYLAATLGTCPPFVFSLGLAYRREALRSASRRRPVEEQLLPSSGHEESTAGPEGEDLLNGVNPIRL